MAFAADKDDKQNKKTVKKSELKGPKAKNYHPAKYDLQTSQTLTVENSHPEKELQGPKAKNYKPGDFEYTSKDLNEVSQNKEKKDLKGPKYKNYRPGK